MRCSGYLAYATAVAITAASTPAGAQVIGSIGRTPCPEVYTGVIAPTTNFEDVVKRSLIAGFIEGFIMSEIENVQDKNPAAANVLDGVDPSSVIGNVLMICKTHPEHTVKSATMLTYASLAVLAHDKQVRKNP